MTKAEKVQLGVEIADAIDRENDVALGAAIAGAIVRHNPKDAVAEPLIARGLTRALRTAKSAGGGLLRRLFGWL